MHGHGKEALNISEQMCEEGIQRNDSTFVCLLSVCRHPGFVDEGMRCYASMTTDYMISINLKHYSCMVGRVQYSHTWPHVWLCLVLAEFMVMWR